MWAASLSSPSKAEGGMWWGRDLVQTGTSFQGQSLPGEVVDQKMQCNGSLPEVTVSQVLKSSLAVLPL